MYRTPCDFHVTLTRTKWIHTTFRPPAHCMHARALACLATRPERHPTNSHALDSNFLLP